VRRIEADIEYTSLEPGDPLWVGGLPLGADGLNEPDDAHFGDGDDDDDDDAARKGARARLRTARSELKETRSSDFIAVVVM